MALVFWIGGMAGAVFGPLVRHSAVLGFACGGVILVCLLVMKFVGPPPHGFFPRLAITAIMMAFVGLAASRSAWSTMLVPVTMALGFVLLAWYVRE
jgi:hypothetical protein